MQDDFDNVPLADQETHEGVRRLLEERKVGDYQLPIAVVAPHIDTMAIMLAQEAARHAPLVVMGGEPGIGKTFHHEMLAESRYYRSVVYCGMGALDINMPRYQPAYVAIDEDKGKPEWQKRRDASARAKAGLVARMKRAQG